MSLQQEKMAEHASLCNEIIELSEKQTMMSKALANEQENSRTPEERGYGSHRTEFRCRGLQRTSCERWESCR
jgi:hypothetical protein